MKTKELPFLNEKRGNQRFSAQSAQNGQIWVKNLQVLKLKNNPISANGSPKGGGGIAGNQGFAIMREDGPDDGKKEQKCTVFFFTQKIYACYASRIFSFAITQTVTHLFASSSTAARLLDNL